MERNINVEKKRYLNEITNELIETKSINKELATKIEISIIPKKSTYYCRKLFKEINIPFILTSSNSKVQKLKKDFKSYNFNDEFILSEKDALLIHPQWVLDIKDYRQDFEKWERISSTYFKINYKWRNVIRSNIKHLNYFSDISPYQLIHHFIFEEKYRELFSIALKKINYTTAYDFIILKNQGDLFGSNTLLYLKIENFDFNIGNKLINKLREMMISHYGYEDSNGKIKYFQFESNLHVKNNIRHSFRHDLDETFKSSMEANLARLFDHLNLKWEYEKKNFGLENLTYLPDFFLKENTLVEAKGFWDKLSRERIKQFNDEVKDYKLYLIDYDMYYTLNKKYKHVIKEWEIIENINVSQEKLPVVGIKIAERQSFVNQLVIDEEVYLERDYNNSVDDNAIRVINKSGKMLGYISEDWADIYAVKIDLGMIFKCTVINIEDKFITIKVKRKNIEDEIIYDFLLEE